MRSKSILTSELFDEHDRSPVAQRVLLRFNDMISAHLVYVGLDYRHRWPGLLNPLVRPLFPEISSVYLYTRFRLDDGLGTSRHSLFMAHRSDGCQGLAYPID